MPTISVLLATHNGEAYLCEAVDSILEQTFRDFEFIIIDDSSTDGSTALLTEYANKDTRIVLVRNESNIGLTRSLNKGLELARGEFVARMDADDIAMPERFAKQVTFLQQHPHIGVLGTGTELISAEGRHLRTDRPRGTTNGVLRWLNFFGSVFVHPSVMMRSDVLRKVGGYDPAFISSQDRDLWDRLFAVTQAANLPDILLKLRLHDTNVSRTRRQEQLHNAAKVAHRSMSRFLGTPLDFALCAAMEHETFENPDQIIAIDQILTPLYHKFVAQPSLLPAEARFVRDDYAHRLYRMAYRWPNNPRMLQILLRAVGTSPTLVFDWFAKQLRRLNS